MELVQPTGGIRMTPLQRVQSVSITFGLDRLFVVGGGPYLMDEREWCQ